MNYKLAKKLKKAGFPQLFGVGKWHYSWEGNEAVTISSIEEDIVANHIEDGCVYKPTLEELINACGDRFSELHLEENGGWWACPKPEILHGNIDDEIDSMLAVKLERGKTAKEAVAKLWLGLKKSEFRKKKIIVTKLELKDPEVKDYNRGDPLPPPDNTLNLVNEKPYFKPNNEAQN